MAHLPRRAIITAFRLVRQHLIETPHIQQAGAGRTPYVMLGQALAHGPDHALANDWLSPHGAPLSEPYRREAP